MEFKEKYINPFTDFGFKKLFGEESHKEFLIDFLNQLLPEKHRVKNLTYMQSEQHPATSDERKAVFDLYCQAENGDRFIVEMQQARQSAFKERMIYYATFPVRDQAIKGEWNFKLNAVYTIAILDFTIDHEVNAGKVFHQINLKDQEGNNFYDGLTFIYLEMPNFVKKESELTTNFDKWLFLLKNMQEMRDKPEVLKEIVFGKFLDAAELANFTPEEVWQYEQSLKHYRDMRNVVTTAFEDGKTEGIEIGREEGMEKGIKEGMEKGKQEGIKQGQHERELQIAAELKANGVAMEIISKTTGLPPEIIMNL